MLEADPLSLLQVKVKHFLRRWTFYEGVQKLTTKEKKVLDVEKDTKTKS